VKPHPQVAALLEAAARSPLPTLDKVSAFVARRLYAERCRTVAPKNPPTVAARIALADGVVLRAYRPSKDDVLPALVFFHGGGWTIGDLDTHDTLCRELAKGANCAVFSVEYRLAPESPFPAAVEDCIAATAYVHREAAALRIDPSRIAVGGDSAGGNLAAVVALDAPKKVCFQLLIYPATDQQLKAGSLTRNGQGYLLTLPLMERFRANYLPNPADHLDWRASPALAKSFKGLPPALILTAGFDPLLDEGREYAELLARDGVEVAYRNYEDMIHGFILMGGVLDTANIAVADCCAALRRAFDKVPA
jgi:acetyl esterase